MIIVNVTELRAHLKDYMIKLEQGDEITIIRNSMVIGHVVPSAEVKALVDEKQSRQLGASLKLPDNREVKFRQLGLYEDPEPVKQLHRAALEAAGAYTENPRLDSDLESPASYYENLNGEFWVGEVEGEIVAMGGFRLHLGEAAKAREAELKRMRVKPELQGRGIGGQLLQLLEGQARRQGYTSMVLDVTSAGRQQAARALYKKQGYQEVRREPSGQHEIIYCRKQLQL